MTHPNCLTSVDLAFHYRIPCLNLNLWHTNATYTSIQVKHSSLLYMSCPQIWVQSQLYLWSWTFQCQGSQGLWVQVWKGFSGMGTTRGKGRTIDSWFYYLKLRITCNRGRQRWQGGLCSVKVALIKGCIVKPFSIIIRLWGNKIKDFFRFTFTAVRFSSRFRLGIYWGIVTGISVIL